MSWYYDVTVYRYHGVLISRSDGQSLYNGDTVCLGVSVSRNDGVSWYSRVTVHRCLGITERRCVIVSRCHSALVSRCLRNLSYSNSTNQFLYTVELRMTNDDLRYGKFMEIRLEIKL